MISTTEYENPNESLRHVSVTQWSTAHRLINDFTQIAVRHLMEIIVWLTHLNRFIQILIGIGSLLICYRVIIVFAMSRRRPIERKYSRLGLILGGISFVFTGISIYLVYAISIPHGAIMAEMGLYPAMALNFIATIVTLLLVEPLIGFLRPIFHGINSMRYVYPIFILIGGFYQWYFTGLILSSVFSRLRDQSKEKSAKR